MGRLVRLLAWLGLTAAALLPTSTTTAAQPSNDGFPGAEIAALPFEDSVALGDATAEPGEPVEANWSERTVWYTYHVTASGALGVDLSASTIPVFVAVWQGESLATLKEVTRGNPSGVGPFDLVFRVEAGNTYRLQAGSYYPYPAGLLVLRITAGEPPKNDQFPGTLIASFPFGDTLDTTYATVTGEPARFGATVWYHAVAPGNGFVVADTRGSNFSSEVDADTEATIDFPGGGAPPVWHCESVMALHVAAAEEVWFQAGGVGFPGERGTLHFTAEFSTTEPPNPCAPEPRPSPGAPAAGTGTLATPNNAVANRLVMAGLFWLAAGLALLGLLRRREG